MKKSDLNSNKGAGAKRPYYGFELISKQKVKEINAEALIYRHVKSGARLLYLKTDDNNKVFSISFRTVPENDTGCAHIMEHSVLNGSKNFPSRGTFNELIKGSLKTFLNAFTNSDWTMYPVASTNQQDFLNLMHVYLDAVFYPKVYDEPNILAQEGWHHEIFAADEEIRINGVVYNEMKGALSTPERLIYEAIGKAQLPDTPYAHNSGGNPKSIPNLNFEQFIAFHRKFYHPSNCMIYLYGDLDPASAMELMDSKYLAHFDGGLPLDPIPLQTAFDKKRKVELAYPVSKDDTPVGKHYLSINYTFGTMLDPAQYSALEILKQILMDTPASPLKQAILESGLAEASWASVITTQQPILSFMFKHVAEENIAKLEKRVTDTLKKIKTDRIDKGLIEAVINKWEFDLREAYSAHYPKGLVYLLAAVKSWNYDGDPLLYLRFEPLLKEVRKGLDDRYYEELIDSAILKNKHSSTVVLRPHPGLNDEVDAALKNELATLKKKLKKKGVDELVKTNQERRAWQEMEEDPQDLALIPFLSLRDINPKNETIATEPEVWREFILLKHPMTTNGIVYLNCYFDLAHAETEDLPWLSLYSMLCGRMHSENYTYAELSNQIGIHTGGISISPLLVNNFQDPDKILLKMQLSGKALSGKVERLLSLITEFALRLDVDDTQRIRQILSETKAFYESYLVSSGHQTAITRMLSPLSHYHNWQDRINGLGFYHFLCGLLGDFDAQKDKILEELKWVKDTFFTQQNLIISLTADNDAIQPTFEHLGILVASVSNQEFAPVEHLYAIHDFNEGITAPISVQYVAKGGNFYRKGFSYSGKLHVLCNILRRQYLHQELRVKGGAYGAFASFSLAGFQYFCSYRDPNLVNSLKVYDEAAEYLRQFDCAPREMEKYIIGTIAGLDMPLTPENKGLRADEDYIIGFTDADRQQVREEVLSTTIADIRDYASMIQAIMSRNHYCVVGSESLIRENADLFDEITPLFRP